MLGFYYMTWVVGSDFIFRGGMGMGMGTGEIYTGMGMGMGNFLWGRGGDGENFMGMGKILWRWGGDGDNFIYRVTL